MKRFVKTLALIAVLAAVLTVSVFAADFEHCADALKELGLFQGTSQGYELDRAPNRAEAGVMLVRLLGQEAEAQAIGEYTAPFTDVKEWAKPYVQYLYDNGLTKGKTETTFGYSDLCTAQQYATFLLRALGYSDAENGDFTYAGALDFAREAGVVDAVNCDAANFLRDDVVAMSYTALAAAPKSGETDLLTKLVKEGAVPDARGYDDQFEAYRDYCKAAAAAADQQKASMVMDLDVAVQLAGASFMKGDMQMDAAMELNAEQMDQSKMAYTMDVNMEIDPAMAEASGLSAEEAKIAMQMNCCYADGYFYMEADGQKFKMPLSFEEALSQAAVVSAADTAEPISMLKSISVSKSSAGAQTYHITYAPGAMNSLIRTVMSAVSTGAAVETPEIRMEELSMDVTVSNGRVSGMKMTMGMEMAAEGQTMAMDLLVNIHDMKTGSAVTVALPEDLDTYQELIGGADAPAAA